MKVLPTPIATETPASRRPLITAGTLSCRAYFFAKADAVAALAEAVRTSLGSKGSKTRPAGLADQDHRSGRGFAPKLNDYGL